MQVFQKQNLIDFSSQDIYYFSIHSPWG